MEIQTRTTFVVWNDSYTAVKNILSITIAQNTFQIHCILDTIV